MWKIPLLEVRTTVVGNGDTDLVAVFQDGGKKAIPPKGNYSHLVEKLRKEDIFNAKLSSSQMIRFAQSGGSGQHALFLGLGQVADLTEEKLRSAGGTTWSKLTSEKVKEVTVHVDSFLESKLDPARAVRAFAEGIMLHAYQITKHKAQNKKGEGKEDDFGPSKITWLLHKKDLKTQIENELKAVSAVAAAVRVTRDWSNEPSNIGTPEYYAGEAKKLARQYGLKYKVLSEADCAKEKMGLFLGVGQGAENEGRFVILEYTPPKATKNTKTVALVGKGITFDSGGISIKPSLKMEDMKHDMTGAATVMGAMMLASQWEISNRVIGIMAFTENMPSGNAIQPGNILTSRNGKTVEVINTDAEGRLILADALDYAQDLKPDAIVNIATLTGAVTVALGKQCCAVLGNDETLIESLKRAGEANGEKMWQLPLFDEYFEDLKSDYADMKNSANDSSGGTIRGAIFLKQFIKPTTRWAHLDIAGVAYHLNVFSYFPKKGASGIYVRTLAQFAADF